MKRFLIKLGDELTRIGEKYKIHFLIYNPIIWGRFLTSSRHGGRIFAQLVKEMFPNIKTCLDVGSGAGGYLYWLKKLGFSATGLEYSFWGRTLARIQGIKTLRFDCGKEFVGLKLGPFDLVYSIEVAEHIPKEQEDRFIDFLASMGKFVIFSAAQPNQPGQGHINCQPLEHWQRMFSKRGFSLLRSETHVFRKRLQQLGFKGFFPKNCQIFQNFVTSTFS